MVKETYLGIRMKIFLSLNGLNLIRLALDYKQYFSFVKDLLNLSSRFVCKNITLLKPD